MSMRSSGRQNLNNRRIGNSPKQKMHSRPQIVTERCRHLRCLYKYPQSIHPKYKNLPRRPNGVDNVNDRLIYYWFSRLAPIMLSTIRILSNALCVHLRIAVLFSLAHVAGEIPPDIIFCIRINSTKE